MFEFNDSPFGFSAPSQGGASTPSRPTIASDPRMQKASELGGLFFERCAKCSGTGRFRSWSGRDNGPCFACKGEGQKTFKTSTAERAQHRASTAARKEAKAEVVVQAFAKAHPEAHAFLVDAAPTFGFAASMLESLAKWGSLTERQLAAVEKCVASRAAKAAERVQRVAAAPVVDVAAIEQAFDKARAFAWKKNPNASFVRVRPLSLKAGEIAIEVQPGSAGSQWEGQLFVKTRDGRKLGSVKGGKFQARRECTDAEQAAVVEACANPGKAAIAFGQAFSTCSVCARELSDPVSIDRGIGPICAEKFGF